MNRKLVKHGPSTLMVSLPRKWIKKNELEKGVELNIEEHDNVLMLSTGKIVKEKKETFVNIEVNDERYIRIVLNNTFRMGFDKVKVNFKARNVFNVVQDVVDHHLLGFEITKKELDYCIIENITEPTKDKSSILLKRMFMIIKDSLNVLEEDMKKNEFENMKVIKQHTSKLGQYDNFCRRSITKGIFIEKNSNFYWSLYRELLFIQRDMFYLYKYLSEEKIKISKETIELIQETKVMFNDLFELFYKKDIKKMMEVNKRFKKIHFGEIYELLSKNKGKENVIIFYLGKLVRKINLCTSPEFSIVFQ